MKGVKLHSDAVPSNAEEQDAQLWAGVRRQERIWAAWFAVVLVILTGYFAGLNAYKLWNAVPRTLLLRLEGPEGGKLVGAYRPRLIWSTPIGNVIHPVIYLGGEALNDVSNSTRLVTIGRVSRLRIRVPGNATGGTHKGLLLLTRVSGNATLPETVSTPVTIGVSSGFWRNWSILRDWCFVAVGLAILFYLFCLVAYPPPMGSLRVVRLGQSIPQEKIIRLGTQPIAWILPWRRSIVPLKWIWKQASIRRRSLEGQINFVLSSQPVLELPGIRRGRVVKRLADAPQTGVEPFGPAIRMADHIFTCEIDGSHQVEIQYLRRGMLSARRA